MIKFQNQVPSVYPNASRDFQYLSWLINIVLNSVKHNVDDIYNLPNNKTDSRLTELLALTLGFKVKRNYDQDQLRALVAALPRILKYKGTITAVEMAGRALIAASGATGDFRRDTEIIVDNGKLTVTLPVDLIDVSLFTDLLSYILPAGMSYHVKRATKITEKPTTELSFRPEEITRLVPDITWNDDTNTSTGLSHMFEAASREPVFTNYIPGTDTPNIGLLNNNIIPLISASKAPMYDLTTYSQESSEELETLNKIEDEEIL